jgi:hypothetical protein
VTRGFRSAQPLRRLADVVDPGEPPSPPREDDGAPAPARGSLEQWIRPFFADSTLWPVLFVMAAVLATFGAAMVLLAVGERNGFAITALALLLVISADLVYRNLRRGRLGLAGGAIVGLWLMIGLIAAALSHSGVF